MNFMPNSPVQLKELSGCTEGLASETWGSTSVYKIPFLVKTLKNFPYVRKNLSQCDRGPICPWTVLGLMFPKLFPALLFPLDALSDFTGFPYMLPRFISFTFVAFIAQWPSLLGTVPWLVIGGNFLSSIYKLLFQPVYLGLIEQFPVWCVSF